MLARCASTISEERRAAQWAVGESAAPFSPVCTARVTALMNLSRRALSASLSSPRARIWTRPCFIRASAWSTKTQKSIASRRNSRKFDFNFDVVESP
jgi:hypothetical protein